MDGAVLSFFSGHEGALPLYVCLEKRLKEAVGLFALKVQKTQISFYQRHMIACVSFLPVRKAAQRPRDYLILTFSLPDQLNDPRIDASCAVSPHRWTHHVLLSSAEEIDDQLLGWIREAAAFSGNSKK